MTYETVKLSELETGLLLDAAFEAWTHKPASSRVARFAWCGKRYRATANPLRLQVTSGCGRRFIAERPL